MKRIDVDTAHADRLLSSGKTLQEVAALLGLNPDNLSKKLRAVGVRTNRKKGRHPPNFLQVDVAALVRAHEAGESVLAMSKRTGLARVVIQNRLRAAGVRLRSGTEANVLRMKRMTKGERQALTEAANEAARGSKRTRESKLRSAAARCRIVGHGEVELAEALRAAGERVDPQRPVGIYNVDLTFGRVAVEVCGAEVDRLRDPKFLKRCEYLEDAGYAVVLVFFRRVGQLVGNLKHVVARLQDADRKPAARRQHWVIRCRSQRFTRFRNKRGQLTGVPTPEGFSYTVRELHL